MNLVEVQSITLVLGLSLIRNIHRFDNRQNYYGYGRTQLWLGVYADFQAVFLKNSLFT